jgi:hypothetical protein
MSRSEYIVDVCHECAKSVLGFSFEKLSPGVKEKKCAFCHKKRYCDVYRVKAEKEE